jgi:hypothetical protein
MILQQEMHPDHGNYTTSTNIQKYINRHIFMLVNIRIMNMHHIYINHSNIICISFHVLKDVHIYHYHECSNILTRNKPRHYFSVRNHLQLHSYGLNKDCEQIETYALNKKIAHILYN